MMAAEGLIIQSVLSRLPASEANLAAFGVAISLAFIVESPIIMLLSASTAYVKGSASYRTVRTVAFALSMGVTAVMASMLIPPAYEWIAQNVLALPSNIAASVYWCIAALMPWPGLIGIRRFYQGVIIAAHQNTFVALGTAFRLLTILVGAVVMYQLYQDRTDSAAVACGVLSCAVGLEMLATRLMARSAVRRAIKSPDPQHYHLTTRQLLWLYIPLALTSMVTMGIGPILVAFMSRFPAAVESLAVYPVVDGLVFQFRSPLFAYQEVAISLFAAYGVASSVVRRVGYRIAIISTTLLATIVITPLASIVYGTFPYQLSASLVERAVVSTAILLPLPFMSAVYSIERAALIVTSHSRQVAYSTMWEAVVTIVILGTMAFISLPVDGVYAASGAILIGKLAAAYYLRRACGHYTRG
jgi:hypothetical protein